MTRILVTLGIILIVVGLLWPYLSKLGLGRLPGDILIRREGMTFYFPIMTSIIISILLTLLFWFFRK
ncbi:hypothetical protein CAI21_00915 [Alkalilimnicola ehrlichii]|uniref:DUF2905 domain-containing protein n=1 Tax=Alkalilimnicola ehrlichii TaxID=351052 RepID=A0A3E0X434_9GAMM|nr:DUF2905 domain-containing protein [Alkalilimnicola ehrlichii]RFA31238.1 hypothetical protein CAI21_00915 [Alkalilimnicola ehrlichii]RFA39484.1 hypothetical protein CAL65_01495 [Alkalilimnicola ehrlichii]